MYDKEMREAAQLLMMAGKGQTETRAAIREQYGVDVPRATMSLWYKMAQDDDALRARAEEARRRNDDRVWNLIGKAQTILDNNLNAALEDADALKEAVGILCSLLEDGMMDDSARTKALRAVDILNEMRDIVSTRDALSVVKDLTAQSQRSEAFAAGGGLTGTIQISLDDVSELSG